MAREVLKGINSENRLSKIRLIMPNDPVIGGQPSDNADEFTSNTPFLDLACSIQYAVTQAANANTAAKNADTKAANAQTAANTANTAAKNADTKAVAAQKTADEAKTAAATADSKAVAAQNTANTANTAASNADKKAGTAQTTANQAKTAAATADGKAVAAQKTADEAETAAATAYSKAVAAQNTANTANTAAKNADTKAGTAQTTANQAKTAAATADGKAVAAQTKANQVPNPVANNFVVGNTTTAYKLMTVAQVQTLLKIGETAVGEIFIFHTKDGVPPAGYIVRNGQAIDKTKMPKLFAEYGATMPDDRNRYYRNQGDLTGAVGTAQEDAIRNIVGEVQGGVVETCSGAFSFVRNNNQQAGTGIPQKLFKFDASKVVPTAAENRVKSRIILACNKVQ